ncbi:MAG: phage minor head protein [Alistipes sp.]
MMSNLYRNAAEHEVENGITFTEEVILQTLHAIYDQQIDTHKQIDAQLFDQIHKAFDRAISVGVKEQPVDNSFMQELKTNNGVFAAFKTHRMQNDMAHQLLDDKGKLKSFQQFRSDVQDIVSHHRDAWLRTEYDTAIKRARKAAQMRQFINERDVLPNLRWLPSTALNPREEHIPFYDHVWPMDSPFWDDHQPGDAWGCQCDWEATDDPVTDNTGLDAPSILPDKGLRGNPAKSGHLFSHDHPYFPDSCSLCPFNTSQLSIFSNKIKDCYNCHNVTEAVQIARTEHRKALDIVYKEVRHRIVATFGYDSVVALPIGKFGGSGKLKVTPVGLRNCLKVHLHTRTEESKQVLFAALLHPEELRHNSRKLLGETKDMNDPSDVKNVAKKRDRGVVAYNYYEFRYNGALWILGFEEVKNGYEQPYFIAQKK